MSWQDVTPSSLCSRAKVCGIKRAHNFLFSKSSFNIWRTTVSWGSSKILLAPLMRFDGHFWPNQQQQQCLPQSESILDGHLSRHLLLAPFRMEIENTNEKLLIGSQPHSHKPFTPVLVFLLQIDWLWIKILWELPVHFRHPWRIKKTDFANYNSYTVEDKQTKLGVWKDVS